MKKTMFILGMIVILMGFMTLNAHATYITGSIDFHADQVTLDTSNVTTATEIMSISNDLHVANAGGTYATLLGGTSPDTSTPAAYTLPLVFQPQNSTPFTLWSFTSAGKTYSFETTKWNPNAVINSGGSQFLNLSGQGIASITGYNDTPGTWSIAITSSGSSKFDFETANSASPVPEPSTLFLLGAGLIGLVAFGKKART